MNAKSHSALVPKKRKSKQANPPCSKKRSARLPARARGRVLLHTRAQSAACSARECTDLRAGLRVGLCAGLRAPTGTRPRTRAQSWRCCRRQRKQWMHCSQVNTFFHAACTATSTNSSGACATSCSCCTRGQVQTTTASCAPLSTTSNREPTHKQTHRHALRRAHPRRRLQWRSRTVESKRAEHL